jgi:hypothetical protein
MQVGDTTILMPVIVPPEIPAVRPPVRQTGDGRSADRDKRGTPDDQRRADFRAALDAATGDLFTQPQTLTTETRLGAQESYVQKLPAEQIELNGDDTSNLYTAALTRPRDDYTSTDETSADSVQLPKQQFRAVTQQYAQRFFSVGGTFAARGDSLEVRA